MPYIGTKGDANADADPVITPRTAIVGRVAFTVPLVGFLLALLSTPVGVLTVFLVAATLLALALLFEETATELRVRATGQTGGRTAHRPAIGGAAPIGGAGRSVALRRRAAASMRPKA